MSLDKKNKKNKKNSPGESEKLRALIRKIEIKQVKIIKAMEDLRAGKSLTKAQLKLLEEFDENEKPKEGHNPRKTRSATEEPRNFINLRHVLVYLLERGYKVSESNLYKHGKESKIHPAPDGTYDLKSVKTYASTYLKTVATGQTEKADELQRKYAKERLCNMQIKNKQDALKLAIREERYILRTLCHEELAARGVAVDHECRFSIQADAAERVEMVEGNMDKVQDLIRFDMQRHDERMNRFATLKEFHVIYEPNETKET